MTFYSKKREFDPKSIMGDEEHYAALTEAGVSVEAASRIKICPVRWLVENVVAYDSVTLIAGAPGTGKTMFACQLAADASRESQLRVVLATSGAESPELLSGRLEQAEADRRRIAIVNLSPKSFKDPRAKPTEEAINERLSILYYLLLAAGDPNSGVLPADINTEEEAKGTFTGATRRAAPVLIIDDIDGWFGKPGNLLPAAALARIIQRLNELARSLHVAIVVFSQSQLSVEGRITSRQLSRVALAASVVWMLVKDKEGSGFGVQGSGEEAGNREQGEPSGHPEGTRRQASGNPKSKIENPKSGDGLGSPSSGEEYEEPRRAYRQNLRRWFMPVKNNLACDAESYGRSFELIDGQVRWHADDPAPSLAEALLPSLHNNDRRCERNSAKEWIRGALADGPLPSKEFFQQAFDSGYSKGTIRRAADELGIHSRKTGFNGGWEMRWVPQPVVTGRGTLARAKGTGFRIVGAEIERGRGGDGERGRRRDGETEGRRDRETEGRSEGETEGRRDRVNASCAPSSNPEEFEAANCAPSGTTGETEGASCAPSAASQDVHRTAGPGDSPNRPHPGPLPMVEGEKASCAPSGAAEPTNPKSKIENPKSTRQPPLREAS